MTRRPPGRRSFPSHPRRSARPGLMAGPSREDGRAGPTHAGTGCRAGHGVGMSIGRGRAKARGGRIRAASAGPGANRRRVDERAALHSPAACGSTALRQVPVSAGYSVTEPQSIATWRWSPRAIFAFRRPVPPVQVPVLKNPAFELMTRSAFIPRVTAEPKQSTNVQMPEESGNPSGRYRPPCDRSQRLPRLCGRDTR